MKTILTILIVGLILFIGFVLLVPDVPKPIAEKQLLDMEQQVIDMQEQILVKSVYSIQ